MSATGDDASKKRSIVIMDMPVEFIDRDILKSHFEQYGRVERLACSVSKKYAVIHFSTPEEAETAAARGAMIRPDAPRLKIVSRAGIAGGSTVPPQKPAAAPQSTRIVTKRKIIRNPFSLTSSSDTSSTGTAHSSSSKGSGASTLKAGTSSASGPPPLRSSIKISRPSPFHRKRPSFGDKTGKGPSPPKNPFSLPPRNMLSLDRRKKTAAATTAAVATVTQDKENLSSEIEIPGEDEPEDTSAAASSDFPLKQEPETSASSVIAMPSSQSQSTTSTANTDDVIGYDDEETESSIITLIPAKTSKTVQSSPVDEDEETQEETANRNVEATGVEEDYESHHDQDIGEATTEEEGEIFDDDQDDDDDDDVDSDDDNNDEEDDEPFESPLKRAEAENKQSTSSVTEPDGGFSFKIKNPSTSSAESKPSSSFKVPFASPFGSSSSAPKPFSSSSFGQLFGVTPGSSSIFSQTKTEAPALPKVQEKTKEKSVSQPAEATFKADSGTAEKQQTQKSPFSFSTASGLGSSTFGASSSSSFGALSSSVFGSVSKSASTSLAPTTSASKTSTLELKPPKFGSAPSKLQVPTVSTASTNVGASSTVSFGLAAFQRKPSSATTTAGPITSTKPSTSRVAFALAPPQTQQKIEASASVVTPKDTPNPLLLTFYPDTAESQELFSKRSTTVEERYRILEARDKIIRTRVPKTKVTVEFATKLIGTCPDMCPEKERYMRQFQRQLVSYETLPGPDFVVDHQKAIKGYSRSSADQEEPLPHELRPGPTLDYTMHYLLRYIVPLGDNPDENLGDWYNFLWDRTRSIRKDITQQQIIDHTAVSLYEKCARFHIHCASRLCELDVHSLDPKLNDENLMKCLQSLEHLYDDLRRRDVICPNEPEFRAYQIMMNLNEGDALYNAQQLPSWILNSAQVQTALKLHHSVYTKNFVAFFRMVEQLPYMTSCILHRYFFQIRSLAMRCFIKAHCTLPKYETAMPMYTLQRMFGFGSDQALSFSYLCEAHGVHCDVDEGKVILKRKMFYLPESPSIYREAHLIDSKLQTSVAEAINGGPLPDIDFANHRPSSSFNENGQMVAGEVVKGVGGELRSGTTEAGAPPSTFIPPNSNNQTSRLPTLGAPVLAPPTLQSGFTFGTFQKRKELPSIPIVPPAPIKPKRDIDAACQVVTTRLIEESVQQDITQLSRNQLDEARRLQEQMERKRLREIAANNIAKEFVEQAILNQVDLIVRGVAGQKLVKLRAVESVSQNAASRIIEEGIIANIFASAGTELTSAKEIQYRLMITAGQIFQRIRARFVVQKWSRFSKARRLAREKEEEKRREQLWNFPVINPYFLSTKDVFRALCGKSAAQPSLSKVDLLNSSPGNILLANVRPKRKSDGDTSDLHESETPKKLPKLDSAEQYNQDKLKDLWEFPVANPYKTNRQVLEALCGSSSLISTSDLPKIAAFDRAQSNFFGSSHVAGDSSNLPFKIRKPDTTMKLSSANISNEIISRTSETSVSLLNDIRRFVSTVQDENKKSENLQQYMQEIETMEKSCSELNTPHGQSFMEDEEDADNMSSGTGEWVDANNTSILSGVFVEEDMLLHQIKNFMREVRHEKNQSWNKDTFLNNIDLDGI